MAIIAVLVISFTVAVIITGIILAAIYVPDELKTTDLAPIFDPKFGKGRY